MNIECSIPGCIFSYNTDQSISCEVRYTCRNHTREELVRVMDRPFDQKRDEADIRVHFQECQFDRDLRRAKSPDGGDREDSFRIRNSHRVPEGEPTAEGA